MTSIQIAVLVLNIFSLCCSSVSFAFSLSIMKQSKRNREQAIELRKKAMELYERASHLSEDNLSDGEEEE